MDQLDLSDFFKTKAEATDFAARLSTLVDKVYQTSFILEKELQEQFGIAKKEKFMTLLRNNDVSADSNTALIEFFKKILAKVAAMSQVTLTIPVEPDEQTLKVLSEWFLLNGAKQMLLDVKVDPKIIAGMTVETKGKFADYSLRPVIDRVVNEVLTSENAYGHQV